MCLTTPRDSAVLSRHGKGVRFQRPFHTGVPNRFGSGGRPCAASRKESSSESLPGPLRMDRETRILIVEDDVWLLETLETALKRLGCDAVGMCNGDGIEKAVQTQAFDLLLCDLIIPGRTGISVIAAVREVAPMLPIIAMTGASGGEAEALLLAARTAGADDTIRKPFRLSDLMEKSRNVIMAAQGRTAN